LALHLPDDFKREMLDAMLAIGDPSTRAKALKKLIPLLPAALREEALKAGPANGDEWFESDLRPCLPTSLKKRTPREALKVARGISGRETRAHVLSDQVPDLPVRLQREAVPEALTDEWERMIALGRLAPCLTTEELQQKALKIVQGMNKDWHRASAIGALAPHLHARSQQEALSMARNISDEIKRGRTLRFLAPYLPEKLEREAQTEVLEARRQSIFKDHLPSWDFQTDPNLFSRNEPEKLAKAMAIDDEKARAKILSNFYLPALPRNLKREALSAAMATGDKSVQADTLNDLVPQLPVDLKREAVPAALEAAEGIDDEAHRASILRRLAPYLPAALKQRPFEAALAISDENDRANALSDLAPYLPADMKEKAFEAAWDISEDRYKTRALNGLAPFLAEELKQPALKAVRTLRNKRTLVEALIGLAPYLPPELKKEATEAALKEAPAIGDGWTRKRIIEDLAPYLLEELKKEVFSEALEAARGIDNELEQAFALLILMQHLKAEPRRNVKSELLQAVQSINQETFDMDSMEFVYSELLAAHLPTEFTRELLQAAQTIPDNRRRAAILDNLTPHLPEDLQPEAAKTALTAFQSIRYESE
jgi:uncharacterized protein YeeX (DUF496 family)